MRDPHTIVSLAAAAYTLITFLVARQVTWWWVLDGNEEFNDETLGERAFTMLAALAAAALWPIGLVIWALTKTMPRTRETDTPTE